MRDDKDRTYEIQVEKERTFKPRLRKVGFDTSSALPAVNLG